MGVGSWEDALQCCIGADDHEEEKTAAGKYITTCFTGEEKRGPVTTAFGFGVLGNRLGTRNFEREVRYITFMAQVIGSSL